MDRLLAGKRVVEGAAFVAAPLCGLTLAQMGAEVIRFDAIGGGPDYSRWPLTGGGASLYWEGLNKGKKSIAIDLRNPRGRELAIEIATAAGEDGGLFVTNYPANGFLSHAALAERRPDLISVRVMGWRDGGNAVDYTINAALGVPMMTGPADHEGPVNHVLPAWDLSTGLYAALSLVSAAWRRSVTGEGAEIRVPLGDVAMATLGNLGQVAEVAVSGADRPRIGNDLFGAYGRDFRTADGRYVMLVAITARQWRDLVTALGIEAEVAAVETQCGVNFTADEGARYVHRAALNEIVEARTTALALADLATRFEGTAVCWSPYNTLSEALRDGPFATSPLFQPTTHASGATYPTPRSPVEFVGAEQHPPGPAPALGAHTDEVLTSVLGLSRHEIDRLHDDGVVAGASMSRS
ncbi:CoA transferase [Acuticoccus mangrovi]|uniref:CoA transferase n=1 Tax=Acuticoccus mangrovi TaxID=2796142 RepID=A0A934IKE0_9HYPH|nr:CoA transferase [Acuticoccus mangrovi]